MLEGLRQVNSLLAIRDTKMDQEPPRPDQVAGDGVTGLTAFEFMRSATAIAQYGLESGKRRSASPAKIKFAAMLVRLWGGAADYDESEPTLLINWWEQAFVTQRMFLPKQDDLRPEADERSYLHAAGAFLDRLAKQMGDRGRLLEQISAQATQLTGYFGVSEAKRADVPWVALENLSYLDPETLRGVVGRASFTLRDEFLDPLQPEELQPYLPNFQDWLAHSDGGYLELSASPASEPSSDYMSPGVFSPKRSPSQGSLLFPVWFGTNRKPAKDSDKRPWYSGNRDETSSLHYGRCLVHIPSDMPFGRVASPWWHRLYSVSAWSQKMQITEVENFANDGDFITKLRSSLSETDDRSILLYIHGYNTRFESAVIRAAQIGHDLEIQGQMALFSWPSSGSPLGYIADQNRADASEACLEKYIEVLANRAGANKINVIAHSMGNRVFSRVVDKFQNLTRRGKIELGVVILAAPDVDRDTFNSLASAFPSLSENTTMYVSSKDKALQLSGHLQSFPRAGYTPPVSVYPGIDTIQVGNVDVSLLGIGHNYHSEKHPVLYDMASLLQGNTNPEKRVRLKKVFTQEGQGLLSMGDSSFYWQLRR